MEQSGRCLYTARCMGGPSGGGGRDLTPPLEIHKGLYVSFEILVQTHLEKQFSMGVVDQKQKKKPLCGPPDEIFWIRA